MKIRTNTGEVELTAEMVVRGMVFRSAHWRCASAPDGVMVMDRPSAVMCGDEHGWTATNGAGVFPSTATLLGCDPPIATRADCERYGIPEHIDVAAHGFARLRDGGAVDLRREMPRGSVYVIGDKRNTWNGRSVPLPDVATFIGLNARYARPEDVERLCCGVPRWRDEKTSAEGGPCCTLAIGPHGEHEDLATGARWRDAPAAVPSKDQWPEYHERLRWMERQIQPLQLGGAEVKFVTAIPTAPKCARCDGPASVKEGHALKIALQASNGSMESGAICDPCAALVHANPEGWVFENGRIRAQPGAPPAHLSSASFGGMPFPKLEGNGFRFGGPSSGMRLTGIAALSTSWLTFVHYGPSTAEAKMRPGEFRCSCGATTPDHAQGCTAPFWLREASAAAWAQMPDVQKAANAGREAMVGASVIGLFVWLRQIWEASPEGQRAKREAALVALVNNVPAGLRPDGWRAAVLTVEEWWRTREGLSHFSGAPELCEELHIPEVLLRDAVFPAQDGLVQHAALAAYRRALAPRTKVAPERRGTTWKTRGLAVVVDDGRDE